MTHIMKLADDYASALVEERTDDCKETAEEVVGRLDKVIATRSALKSAIESLQAKLEASNQLAQLNAEIGISLKKDCAVLKEEGDQFWADAKRYLFIKKYSRSDLYDKRVDFDWYKPNDDLDMQIDLAIDQQDPLGQLIKTSQNLWLYDK